MVTGSPPAGRSCWRWTMSRHRSRLRCWQRHWECAFSNGIAYVDRTARLTFRRADGTLRNHPLTNGIEQVATFGGSAFRLEQSGDPLLVFGPAVRSWAASDSSEISVAGWLQGAVRSIGKGRVALFGEAGMFTAQLNANGNPMGMNADIAKQNSQFLLNVVHWLTGTR